MHASRFFFVSPASSAPNGGVRKIYRFAEILREASHDAAVVHPPGQCRPKWFSGSNVPVISTPSLNLTSSDIVVIPEGPYAWRLSEEAPGTSRVILNLGAYRSFHGAPHPPATLTPYQAESVIASVVVCEDNRCYLEHAFPEHPVHRVRLGVDRTLYRPRSKHRQIAYMPRRRKGDIAQVLGILAARGVLEGWSLCPIDGVSCEEAARLLGESEVFLAFALTGEGIALPAIEAMASGCVVVGFNGRGGDDYFAPEHSFKIPEGDIVEFTRQVEHVLGLSHARRSAIGEAARAFVLEHFSVEQEVADVKRIFESFAPLPHAQGGAMNLACLKSPSRARITASRIRRVLAP